MYVAHVTLGLSMNEVGRGFGRDNPYGNSRFDQVERFASSYETPGWQRPQIDQAIRSGDRLDAKLSAPVPVHWVYITAWATPEL